MNIKVNFKISIINNTPWVKTKYKMDYIGYKIKLDCPVLIDDLLLHKEKNM